MTGPRRTAPPLRPLLLLLLLGCASGPSPEPIRWADFDGTSFERARAEDRLVILHVRAVWCHWCHVMEETTYQDPEVVRHLQERYVTVRVDQDARPDLALRYRQYGWPATVIFDAEGREIGHLTGYVAPQRFLETLRRIERDPSAELPTEIVATEEGGSGLAPALRASLLQQHEELFDAEDGGFGRERGNRFVDWDRVEYDLECAREGDESAAARARRTLESGRKLIDPVWGGVYQYSQGGDFDHPHFERILQYQAEILRVYVQSYLANGDPRDLESARAIHRFVADFLRAPDGGYFTSMDADLVPGEHSAEYFALDDAGRRSLGVPRVDRHQYARENGWALTALCWLYAATDEVALLDEAKETARWVLDHRGLPGGGFRHEAEDEGGPFLEDTLQMVRGLWMLATVSGEREPLERALEAADFLCAHFTRVGEDGLYLSDTGTAPRSGPFAPARHPDPNVEATRLLSLLVEATGRERYREVAERCLRYLATPEALSVLGLYRGGLLLADREWSKEPLHVTICGPLEDPTTRSLLAVAMKSPRSHKRIEIRPPGTDPLRPGDFPLPEFPEVVAFVCGATSCSPPLRGGAELRQACAER